MPANRNYGLKLADPDGLERWRAEAEALEREAKDRAERRESRMDVTVALVRDEMRGEIDRLRAEMAAQKDLMLEAVGQCIGEYADRAEDCTERAIKRIQEEFWTMTARRFAELNAHIDMTVGKSRSEKPRGEVQDLPNPLASRRGLN
jgi:hypothetical protein